MMCYRYIVAIKWRATKQHVPTIGVILHVPALAWHAASAGAPVAKLPVNRL
jgi:hypothetical protein